MKVLQNIFEWQNANSKQTGEAVRSLINVKIISNKQIYELISCFHLTKTLKNSIEISLKSLSLHLILIHFLKNL